ncbi:MAG: EAL domain-containing protein [Acidobacteria bacterium]|nr:EAL domain-containing protein [Acidobacteriota bacterium]
MIHSLLNRLLKKSGIDITTPPTVEKWQDFLQRVNRTYIEADQERYLLERSLAISSEEMQETYERLRKSETRYALAAKGANDGLWDWDLVHEDIYYSQRWMDILGIVPDGKCVPTRNCWFNLIHPEERDAVVAELEAHLEGRIEHFENEHRILHRDGEYRWVLIRGQAVRDETGRAVRIAGSLTDITKRKRAEEKLAYDAIHDNLTGLPNRKNLMLRLERSIERKRYQPNYNFAVLFIDLDRFKTVNDTLGHYAGDELLQSITEKLCGVVRPNDMVARLGGDEFIVLIDNVKNIEQVTSIAERILGELQKPVHISGQDIYSSASIGIVLNSTEHNTPDEIVRDADLAMYRAKVKGKARYEIFDIQMHSGAISALQLEIDLRRAIKNKEFLLYYQPIVALGTENIAGFEVLIRWNHPTRGVVPPNDFIPLAEETGLILPIGSWVMRESCRQMSDWQKEYPSAENLLISINLSARQLEQPDLISQIVEILDETGLSPRCMKLEITESVVMNNAEQSVKTIDELRKMGIRVSIDDFGTGYSSLSYLHRFPIDTLKIDRSFVMRIGEGGESSEIVQTIINLASNLGMEVVAEGVETAEQLNFLRGINCGFGQGYYYSRPIDHLSATEMIEKLKKDEVHEPIGPVIELNLLEKTVH